MPTFLDLLYDEAPLAAFDEHLAQREAGADEAEAARLRSEYDVALRLRDLMSRMRSREAELSALYETASDLTAIRDVDTILAAIVLVISLVGLRVGVQLFDREAILTRWR